MGDEAAEAELASSGNTSALAQTASVVASLNKELPSQSVD
jgi:hypothetical protein